MRRGWTIKEGILDPQTIIQQCYMKLRTFVVPKCFSNKKRILFMDFFYPLFSIFSREGHRLCSPHLYIFTALTNKICLPFIRFWESVDLNFANFSTFRNHPFVITSSNFYVFYSYSSIRLEAYGKNFTKRYCAPMIPFIGIFFFFHSAVLARARTMLSLKHPWNITHCRTTTCILKLTTHRNEWSRRQN